MCMKSFQPIFSEVVQDRQIRGQNGKVSEIHEEKHNSSGMNPEIALFRMNQVGYYNVVINPMVSTWSVVVVIRAIVRYLFFIGSPVGPLPVGPLRVSIGCVG